VRSDAFPLFLTFLTTLESSCLDGSFIRAYNFGMAGKPLKRVARILVNKLTRNAWLNFENGPIQIIPMTDELALVVDHLKQNGSQEYPKRSPEYSFDAHTQISYLRA
jgi:hypothetical protein